MDTTTAPTATGVLAGRLRALTEIVERIGADARPDVDLYVSTSGEGTADIQICSIGPRGSHAALAGVAACAKALDLEFRTRDVTAGTTGPYTAVSAHLDRGGMRVHLYAHLRDPDAVSEAHRLYGAREEVSA